MKKISARLNSSGPTRQKRGLRLRSFPCLAVLIGLGLGALLIMESTVLFPWRADADTTATLDQNAFRFYVDNDLVQPADAWPAGATDLAENTAITTADTPPDDNQLIRMRVSLGITGDTMAAASQAFKLQYGEGTDCAAIVTWNDVGAAGSDTIWRGESDATPADGTTVSAALLSTAGTLQTYEEENNSALNPNQATAGQSAEWDWLVQNYGALHDTTYCFRMAKSDGTALNTYTQYPKIQTEATVFDSSFEQGNGYNFTKPYGGSAAKFSFESELDPASQPICAVNNKQGWFYFSFDNALHQSFDITLLHAIDNNNQTGAWGHDLLKPIYSYDQVTWYRLPAVPVIDGVNRTYSAPGGGAKFTQDTVYFAFGFPYSYSDYLADRDVWDNSPYVTVTDIGDSIQGRQMDLLTIQDTNSPVPAAEKKVYWHLARQHAMEMPGSNAIDAIIRFLIGGSDEAKLMLRSSIFKIIPMMNPDAAYNGYTRTNADGCDLNREWLDTGPDIANQTTEVYLAHTAIADWMTNGTPNTVNVFTDHHSITSMQSTIYDGDSAMNGTTDNPYEKLFEILDTNAHDPVGNYVSSSAGLFNVEIYDQYNATKGSLAFTHENSAIMHWGDVYPTVQSNEAYGIAWLKTIFAANESNAKIFGLSPSDAGGSTDQRYYVAVSPNQYTIAFDEDRGGGIARFWDRENNANMTFQQVDAERVLDDVEWNNGTVLRTNNSTNAALTVVSNTGNHLRLKYEGLLGNVADVDYTHERSIWEDGKIWSAFTLTNNTGSPIDWADMAFDVSVENGYAARYSAAYDNTADPPTAGTDRWFGFFGTGGYKTNAFAHFVGQTGGWVYDDYTTTSDANGTRNAYTMTNGPSQADGSPITTYLAYQLRPDLDVVANEAAVDVYRNDIASPDTPTMTTGTFSSFDKQEGSLTFGTTTNHLVFTYTNADTVTKKRPTYVVTGYTASTAPTLSVNDAYLDGEDGSAHSGTTHIGASYTSSVDTTNDIAYVQYLGDISANYQARIGDTQSYTLTYTAGANGSITGTSPQTVDHGADGTEVTAVPDTGYHFTSWSDGILTAARTDINVTDDITATASFAINTYTLTYTAGANGSITGDSPQTVNYGADGSEVVAVPDANYHFTSWSDGVLTAARTETNVVANVTVTASFAIDTFTLTYTAGTHGSITGTTPQTVNYGADGSEVTAVPGTGYHFTSWSDGVLTTVRTDENVTSNISVTANFAIDTHTLTYTAGTHGSITGTTPQTVNYGADGAEVTAVPSTNYYFVDWSDDSTENPRTDTNVTNDISVTANFAPITLITDVTEKNITTSTATITWATNHAATSKIEYGTTTAYGNTETDSAEATEHEFELTGLHANTTYHYRVVSVGNTTATSVDGTFTTATEPVRPPAPTITIPANQATLINAQPVIFGYAKSGNTILVYIDGDYKGKTETSQHASGTGNFTYSPSSALGLGWHTLIAKAENDDGIKSKPSKIVRFKIEAPYVTPTILHAEVHDGTSPTIVITGLAKNDSIIQVLIDGVITEEHAVLNHLSGTANFCYTITTDSDLSIGQHALTLVARDHSGKPSLPSSQIYFTKTEIKVLPLPGLNPVLTSPVTYIVQTGDSLWKIAKRFIGFGVSYNDIVWANRESLPSLLKNPSLLLPGWSLLIPLITR